MRNVLIGILNVVLMVLIVIVWYEISDRIRRHEK